MGRRKYLVTGATGFLGHHLLPLIFGEGSIVHVLACESCVDEVVVLSGIPRCELPINVLTDIQSHLRVFKGSILDTDVLAEAARGCDGIYHLAGAVLHSRKPALTKITMDVNVTGTKNVMDVAAASGCRVVYASSSGVVGCSLDRNYIANDKSPYCEKETEAWPYYQSKIIAEKMARDIARQKRVPLVCMRPSMMFGPGDDRFRSTKTILDFLDRKIPLTPPGGIGFVDVRDAASAFHQAMNCPEAAGHTFLLGAMNCSLDEFFDLLSHVSGVPRPRVKNLPPSLLWVLGNGLSWFNETVRGQYNPNLDIVRVEMSCHFWNVASDDAIQYLGFKPRSPISTLADTVRWIHDNRNRLNHPRRPIPVSNPSTSSTKLTTPIPSSYNPKYLPSTNSEELSIISTDSLPAPQSPSSPSPISSVPTFGELPSAASSFSENANYRARL